jgi:hypothetical protein
MCVYVHASSVRLIYEVTYIGFLAIEDGIVDYRVGIRDLDFSRKKWISNEIRPSR